MSEGVRGEAIPRFSLSRPVTVAMAFVSLLVLGTIAYRNIPLELIPSGFTPPFLYVQVPTLRSSPSDVEERIALPVEEMLATVANVDTLGTRVRAHAASFFLEFADGTDMDVAYNQVRDRLDRAVPSLGDDVGQYYIWKYNPADEPILWFGVTFDGVDNPGWLVEHLIAPRIERTPGVSRVEVFGAPQRVVAVEVDDRGADAAGSGLYALITRLSNDNFALGAGAIEDEGLRFPLRVVSRYESLEEIRDLPVGMGLRLRDIASVEVEDRAERAIYRVNQQPSIFLGVYKESSANTVEVGRAVRRVVTDDLSSDPRAAGTEYHFFFDQGGTIEDALRNLQGTALWGGVFAVVVLMVFLRRPGITVLISLAIPTSLLATVVVMYFTGRTLNVLSLTGLMLSVGLVVDNSIVVVESIQTRMGTEPDTRRAALHGAAEVALAILVATLTTVVVFLPMILMTGSEMISFYLSQIGIPVCLALVASLVVSLVFLPLAAAHGLARRPPARVRTIDALQVFYERSLRWWLRHRADMVIVGLLAFASLFYPMSKVVRTDQSEPNINDFRVFLSMPDEYSWSERTDVLLAFEQAIWDQREELGVASLLVRMGGEWGRPQLRAFLLPPDDRELGREEIIERTIETLPDFPGVTHSMSWDAPTNPTDTTVVRLVGPDSGRLAELAEEAARRLRAVRGVTSVRTESGDEGRREIHFVVEPERALRLGLSAWAIGGTIDFALRGRRLESFHAGEEELPIMVQGDLAEVDEVAEIRNLRLPGLYDDIVLADVARSSVVPAYDSIDREGRRTVLALTVQTTREDIEELGREIDAVMEGMAWPRGYSMELGGRFEDLKTDQREQRFALMLAVCFVFLLMGVLFESIALPFSILLSIPFAFVGVYWMLFLTDTAFDLMAGVGLIILIGIVVNNAIVLVDRIGDLRRQGLPRDEAVALAGRQRLRPILMTALTTIFGLVPMSVGTSSLIGIPYSPMGRAVVGGLMASTALTLFVVPLFYTLLDDLRGVGRTALAAVLRR